MLRSRGSWWLKRHSKGNRNVIPSRPCSDELQASTKTQTRACLSYATKVINIRIRSRVCGQRASKIPKDEPPEETSAPFPHHVRTKNPPAKLLRLQPLASLIQSHAIIEVCRQNSIAVCPLCECTLGYSRADCGVRGK